MKSTAINALSSLFEAENTKVIEQIMLGRKYEIKEWHRIGYKQLVQQPTLDPVLLSSSGLDTFTIARLYSARESVYSDALAVLCRLQGESGYRYSREPGGMYTHGIQMRAAFETFFSSF